MNKPSFIKKYWQDGENIDYDGVNEKQDEQIVMINGMHYVKAACEFKVR